MTPAEAILIAIIAVTAILTATSMLADRWIRKNIPLPEDYPGGEDAEAAMIAEFERIRQAHQDARRRYADGRLKGDPPRFNDCA